MLAEQIYDGHASVHDGGVADKLGLPGAPIEGPTHFSQFDPLAWSVWGQRWFETGCISAHFQTMVIEGDSVTASLTRGSEPDIARIDACKADGTPGVDWLAASSAYLSKDRRAVFIGVPGMKPVMQLRVGWSLATQRGTRFEANAYTTPYELAAFDPRAEGFGDIAVDLTPRAALAQAAGPVTVGEGQRLYQLFGCVACHSADGTDVAKVGPTWLGLYGRERPVVINRKKSNVRVDEAYLRESILDPLAKVVSGYEKGEYAMPSYAGVVNDSQIEALTLYIRSLKDVKAAATAKPVVNAEEFQ